MFSTLIATGLYVVASRTPQFLIDKRALRGGGNIHNGIFAGVFGLLAGAQTVRTIYKFNDGHKEYSDDHSQHWIALAIELFNSISLPKFFLKIPENSDYFIFCFQLTLLL